MYRFIINPAARSWHCRDVWEKIEKILQDSGVEYSAHFTEEPGHAGQLAAELSAEEMHTEYIGLLGGDGTVNEFASGYPSGCSVPVLYVPSGSGNDFARGLKLRTDEDHAVDFILHPEQLTAKPVDICELKLPDKPVRRYMVSGGIGYDAAVCWDLLHSRIKGILNKIHLGKLCYLMLGIKNIFFCPLTNGTLVLNDGENTLTLKKIAFISFHNLPYEGGGFFFAPEAETGDGQLDVCVVTARNHFRFLAVLAGSVFKGSHIKMKGVHYLRCRSAEIRLEKPLCIHTDGEVIGFYDRAVFSAGKDFLNLLQ